MKKRGIALSVLLLQLIPMTQTSSSSDSGRHQTPASSDSSDADGDMTPPPLSHLPPAKVALSHAKASSEIVCSNDSPFVLTISKPDDCETALVTIVNAVNTKESKKIPDVPISDCSQNVKVAVPRLCATPAWILFHGSDGTTLEFDAKKECRLASEPSSSSSDSGSDSDSDESDSDSVDELFEAHKELERDAKEENERIAQLNDELDTAREMNARLSEELKAAQDKPDLLPELEDANGKIARLTKELYDATEKAARLSAELEAEQDKPDLRSELNDAKRVIERLTDELASAQNNEAQLRRDVEDALAKPASGAETHFWGSKHGEQHIESDSDRDSRSNSVSDEPAETDFGFYHAAKGDDESSNHDFHHDEEE